MKLIQRFMLIIIIVGVSTSVAQSTDTIERKEIMHQVFDAMANLLPLSLNYDDFTEPSAQPAIQFDIDVLLSAANALEKHAQDSNYGYLLRTQSFSRSIGELKFHFENDQTRYAQIYIFDLAQHCAVCHSSQPASNNISFSGRILDQTDENLVTLPEKAQLQLATRQFDDALLTLKSLILDADNEPARLDRDGVLIDYLATNIRTQHKFEKSISTLRAFSKRQDLPLYLERHVDFWLTSIQNLSEELNNEPNLGRARELFVQSDALGLFPGGQERLIYDLVVSSILYQYVDSQNKRQHGEDLAEAFYMLAVVEARTARQFWAVPHVEFLFEAAIRSAPDSSFAREAYVVLEEFSHLGGSSSEELEKIESLRKLINKQ